MKTSDMEWKVLPIGQLKPAAYNPRKQLKPGDKEYEKIKNSIQEFGYVEPVIVNYDMTVIGGHQRLTVLKELGYEEVQCVVSISRTNTRSRPSISRSIKSPAPGTNSSWPTSSWICRASISM